MFGMGNANVYVYNRSTVCKPLSDWVKKFVAEPIISPCILNEHPRFSGELSQGIKLAIAICVCHGVPRMHSSKCSIILFKKSNLCMLHIRQATN